MMTMKNPGYMPVEAFAFAPDECFGKADWVRMLAGPDRVTLKRNLDGSIADGQIFELDYMIMELLSMYRSVNCAMLKPLLAMAGMPSSPDAIEESLARLMRLRLAISYRLAARSGEASAPVYSLTGPGMAALRAQTGGGVFYCQDLQDSPKRIAADMTAARIAMSFLRTGCVSGDPGVRVMVIGDRRLNPDALVRPTGKFMLTSRMPAYMEVVSRGDEECLFDKLRRYEILAQQDMPFQMIICTEDEAHSQQLEALLDERGIDLFPLYVELGDTCASGLTDKLYCFVHGRKRRVTVGREQAA